MTDRELMQRAMDALDRSDYLGWQSNIPIIKALRERLAQPEQEPRREWVGLTAKDLAEIPPSCFEGAIWADAKLKERNK